MNQIEAQRKTEIPMAIDRLSGAIQRNQDIINELGITLQPVLIAPDPTQTSPTPPEPSSSLAAILEGFVTKMYESNEMLSGYIQRNQL